MTGPFTARPPAAFEADQKPERQGDAEIAIRGERVDGLSAPWAGRWSG